jgi:hypothetical protein
MAAAGAATVPERPVILGDYNPNSELPDEVIAKIFDELDLDGSGYVSEQNLAEAFAQLQLPFARGYFVRSLQAHDNDGDGQLSLTDFSELIRCGSAQRHRPGCKTTSDGAALLPPLPRSCPRSASLVCRSVWAALVPPDV